MVDRVRRADPIIMTMLGLFLLSLLSPRSRAMFNTSRVRQISGNTRRRPVLRMGNALGNTAMATTAEKTDPALWEKVKHDVTEGDQGGKPGQWSARKAQLAVHDYKAAGGDYAGPRTEDNHLHQWTGEQWGTRSGKPSGETGERYLPEKAREHLTKREYDETTAKKRADTGKGRQFSAQPPAIARKTAQDRDGGPRGLAGLSRKQLVDRAAAAKVVGRSRMTKGQLIDALSQ